MAAGFRPWPPPDRLEPGSTLAAGMDSNFYVVSAPGWRDVADPPGQIETFLDNSNLIVSQFTVLMLAIISNEQGYGEF